MPSTTPVNQFTTISGGLTSAATPGFGGTPIDITIAIAHTVDVILGILGIVFMILCLYAGFLHFTALGDPAPIKKANDILKRGVIGMIFVVAAYAISFAVVTALKNAVIPETPASSTTAPKSTQSDFTGPPPVCPDQPTDFKDAVLGADGCWRSNAIGTP